jgi:hypothetical protein
MFSMAKRRVRKSKQAAPEDAAVKPELGTTEAAAAGKASVAKPKLNAKLRKQLRRLERQLADATKAEARRVRRLEKARWLRQRLEAVLDEVRANSPAAPAKAAKPAARFEARLEARTEATEAAKLEAKTARRARPKGDAPATAERSTEAAAPAMPAAPAAPAPTAKAPARAKARVAPSKLDAAAATPAQATVEAYCLREKKRVQMVDPKPVVTANGGAALSGTCPSCGAALYKLVSRTAH